jgi:hypothetical protein
MTVERCKLLAAQKGYAYTALHRSRLCYGGNDITPLTAAGPWTSLAQGIAVSLVVGSVPVWYTIPIQVGIGGASIFNG